LGKKKRLRNGRPVQPTERAEISRKTLPINERGKKELKQPFSGVVLRESKIYWLSWGPSNGGGGDKVATKETSKGKVAPSVLWGLKGRQ